MSKRNIFILVVISILAFMLFSSYKSGYMKRSNIVSEYDSIEELIGSLTYKVNIPEELANEEVISIKNYQGSMVEINTESYSFRASQFIDNNICLLGDYDKYSIDKTYTIKGDTILIYLRVRGEETEENMQKAIIDYNTGRVAYSLKFNSETSLNNILSFLGIEETWLNESSEEE